MTVGRPSTFSRSSSSINANIPQPFKHSVCNTLLHLPLCPPLLSSTHGPPSLSHAPVPPTHSIPVHLFLTLKQHAPLAWNAFVLIQLTERLSWEMPLQILWKLNDWFTVTIWYCRGWNRVIVCLGNHWMQVFWWCKCLVFKLKYVSILDCRCGISQMNSFYKYWK